ncbi:type IVB secretion system protein IcmH/DotU [Photobacterium sp. CCB-ST2H9]|uniref:type IVB secretion system protein IcmH/DotU n=1 Tax=unclassified Photobacterium TaxID=2628852 RepID=UPI002003210A|nr:type IVB secretion system protein IcmH/DotU [Photobacterium sp. CCB-ST2H9]UTM57047.1 type IVB secretion system protein IcmH/DotU [Photobacterium sp. CCB-ST2H9]
MAGLFNEEPTVQIRRVADNPARTQRVAKTSQADISGTERLIESFAVYGSPLLNAATELLGILVTVPRQGSPRDIDRFRQKLLDAIALFRQRGLYLEYHPSIIDKSCFVLCAAFDEAILYTSWGERARWENHSLLSKVFSQRNGGEAFFALLEKASQQPGKLVDFIELQYVLLMLGFKGRYRHDDESPLHEIKSDVYALIRHYRSESALPVPRTPELLEGKQPWRMLSMGKTLGLATLIAAAGYGASEYWYYNRSQPILEQFSTIDMSGVNLKRSEQELVYLSTDEDIGRAPPDLTASAAKPEKETAQQWEIVLAVFSRADDAVRLASELKQGGYDSFTRETSHGIELFIRAGDNLAAIRKLKNELNVRLDLNATIRRAQK